MATKMLTCGCCGKTGADVTKGETTRTTVYRPLCTACRNNPSLAFADCKHGKA